PGFGCRHHGAFDDRRIADDDLALPLRRQHLDCHFTVGLGAPEIDEDRNAALRPGFVDRLHDLFDAGAEAAIGIAAAKTKRHFIADHLTHHVGGAAGNVGRMRHDHDADLVAHDFPSNTSQTASTISSLERAPGSIWPMERSPKKEARPRMAFMGTVLCADSLATARRSSKPTGD